MSAEIYIGTSGWHYDHWEGPFYPSGISDDTFLEYYADRFRTAEINNSFYQLPKKETLLRWRDAVPEDFVFSVKASRYLTHMKKLKDPEGPLFRFLDRVGVLEDKLGPILFQLPPRWGSNPERLEAFLEILPENQRYAFELRIPAGSTTRFTGCWRNTGRRFASTTSTARPPLGRSPRTSRT
jgi:uncharacterized protein YecE (DUF72 family)